MSDDTLTLRATGPAAATVTDDHDGVEIATTTEVDLTATLEIDAEWLAEHGYVSERSEARVYVGDVAELVCETRSGSGDTEFAPRDGWTIELAGSFEEWAAIAARSAQRTVNVGTDDKVANIACMVLDGLSEHADSDRPRLVMLDICEDYDPSDYSRETLPGVLAESPDELPEVTTSTEATADD